MGSKRSFFYFLKKKFTNNSKLTVMLVPDNQSKVRNYNVSKTHLCILILSVFTIFSFSTITLGRYIYYSVREHIYSKEHNRFAKEISHLLANSGKIMIAQEKFNNTLNGLLSDIGLKSAVNPNFGVGGPLVSLQDVARQVSGDVFNSSVLDKISSTEEVDILADLSNSAQVVEKKIRLLTNKVKTFESIVRYIPSIWPLKGEGKILDSHGGIMMVSTVPFTPVIATAEGKVAGVAFLQKGIKVTLLHKYQFISSYNGLFQLAPNVKKDALIRKGDIIGYVSKNKGSAILRYGLFIGNHRGIYPLDPLGFSYMGR